VTSIRGGLTALKELLEAFMCLCGTQTEPTKLVPAVQLGHTI